MKSSRLTAGAFFVEGIGLGTYFYEFCLIIKNPNNWFKKLAIKQNQS
jgi:hypothetical protein